MKFLLLLVLTSLLVAQDSPTDPWPLRWRVFADPAIGLAFRHPYLVIPAKLGDRDLYRLDLTSSTFAPTAAIRVFTRNEADPRAAGDQEAGAAVTWAPWTPTKPQDSKKDPKKAAAGPTGVLGTIGQGPAQRTILALGLGTRTVGLVLAGAPEACDNPGILASVEVLPPVAKGRPAPATARDLQGRQGLVLDATGAAVDPRRLGKIAPVAWGQAWELETEHYHLTGNTSPARLAWHGGYLEALYRAYAAMYQPTDMPADKCEVHLFDTQAQFHAAANAWGNRLPPAGGNSILGGFFAPGLLSLWVFEESGALGGPDFSIEHVLAHECSHQFLHLATHGNATVPTWLNEGLAVYFESGVFRNGTFEIRSPRDRIDRLKNTYQATRTTLVPLEQYIDHRGPITADQYGEVYAMTHFWLFGTCSGPQCPHRTCGLARFHRYWEALKTGADGTQAFETQFMTDIIKAQGGREQGLAAWKAGLLGYVKTLK